MNKKAILIISMFFLLCAQGVQSAGEEATISIVPSSSAAMPGEEYYITVYIDPNGDNVSAFLFSIDFTVPQTYMTRYEFLGDWGDTLFKDAIPNNATGTISRIQAFITENYSSSEQAVWRGYFISNTTGTVSFNFDEVQIEDEEADAFTITTVNSSVSIETVVNHAIITSTPSNSSITVGDSFNVTLYLNPGGNNASVWKIPRIDLSSSPSGIFSITGSSFLGIWNSSFTDSTYSSVLKRFTNVQSFITEDYITTSHPMWKVDLDSSEVGITYFDIFSEPEMEGSGGETFTVTWSDTYVTICPENVASFSAFQESLTNMTNISLSWNLSTAYGADKVFVYGSSSGYITTRSALYLLYEGENNTYLHTDPNIGETWYYTLWTYNETEGIYSVSYMQASCMTTSPDDPIPSFTYSVSSGILTAVSTSSNLENAAYYKWTLETQSGETINTTDWVAGRDIANYTYDISSYDIVVLELCIRDVFGNETCASASISGNWYDLVPKDLDAEKAETEWGKFVSGITNWFGKLTILEIVALIILVLFFVMFLNFAIISKGKRIRKW